MAAQAGTAAALESQTHRAQRARRREERKNNEIFGVPARFMRPRLILIVVVGILVAFGLLMIYSSSSIMAQNDPDTGYDAMYYVKHQAVFAFIGIIAAIVLAKADYHDLIGRFFNVIWGITLLMLLLIFLPIAGTDAYGATRWISIGSFSLQPSEFAKITILLAGAKFFAQHQRGLIDDRELLKRLIMFVIIPLGLILLQPDKGTVMIIAVTLIVMAFLAGIDKRLCAGLLIAGVLAMAVLSMRDAYSRARIVTMLNPWSDPYGDGYQLIQGFYAFGSGGLFGVGIGFSRQKYSYLPMAHNDFIFAVIGEELGLVGTIGLLAGFAVLLWAGFRIARFAPDLEGRLIAAGCVSMLVIQLCLNVAGVLGIFPLSGKPIPFISYGGSSILSSLLLVGLVLSVSVHSHLPETSHDRRRKDFSVTTAPGRTFDSEGVSEATPRSQRGNLTVHEGGLGGSSVSSGRRSGAGSAPLATMRTSTGTNRRSGDAPRGRLTTDASGHRRLDLGPSAAERLRGTDKGPTVRERPGQGTVRNRRDGGKRGR